MHRQPPAFKPTRVAPLAWIAMATASVALGGCSKQSQLVRALHDEEKTSYAKACASESMIYKKRLVDGEHDPVRMAVRSWEGGPTDPLISEAQLVAALEGGSVGKAVIYARGGQGKSWLADALRAQLCATTPAFVVDLKDIAALDNPSADGITTTILRKLDTRPDHNQTVSTALATNRFVLFADHIEETPYVRRAKTMEALLAFAERHPQAQVVMMARPPVLDSDYGFGAKVQLEIPPLDCKAADAKVAKEFKSEDERGQFEQLLKRYGINEKGSYGAQCVYPYLSTYRDIEALAGFFRKVKKEGLPTSFSSVYEALIGERLSKEFSDLKWMTPEALDMGDRLVRIGTGTAGQHNLRFDMAQCEKAIDPRWGETAVDAGVAGDAADRKRHVCEKTFQSAMFRTGDGGQHVFADRQTTDLFQARWLNYEVARAGGQDCTVLGKHDDLVTQSGVTTFLAGQRLGQRCLAQVIAQGCKHVDKTKLTTAIELGLPTGKDRLKILQDARAAGSGLQPEACIKDVLDNLDQTVSD